VAAGVVPGEIAESPAGPAKGVVTVAAAGRSAGAVAADLMDRLVDEPQLIECDLAGVAAEGSVLAREFAPMGDYLARWPGTLVSVHAPDPLIRASLIEAPCGGRLLIRSSLHSPDAARAHLLPPLSRAHLVLSPNPGVVSQVRAFVTRTLLDWQLSQLIAPATELAGELAQRVLTDRTSEVELMVGHVDGRVRVAVRSREPWASSGPARTRPSSRRLPALADAWDVIAAPSGGRTGWAVVTSTVPGGLHSATWLADGATSGRAVRAGHHARLRLGLSRFTRPPRHRRTGVA
jgi:hypothetical protein